MKLLQIPKFSKLKLRQPRKQPPQKKLQARVRGADPAMMDAYEEEEPQTKLTSAFIVVFILHVVAIGGIYAFNQIKASRRLPEPVAPAVTAPAAATTTRTAPAVSPNQVESDQAALVRTTAPAATAPLAPIAPVLKQRVYNVKPGDTLHGIARSFNVSMADLKAANGLSGDTIRPGQVLNLPNAHASEASAAPVKTAAAPAESKPSYRTYSVKSGDRLIFIAKKFSVSQEDIIAVNKLKDPGKLQIGQTLKIPAKK